MIKPNTLCMIRGILPTSRGYDTNGAIVLAVQPAEFHQHKVWFIEPHLQSRDGIFRGALAENLFPLDNPANDAIDVHSTIKEYND
jgi:hypothetical protein